MVPFFLLSFRGISFFIVFSALIFEMVLLIFTLSFSFFHFFFFSLNIFHWLFSTSICKMFILSFLSFSFSLFLVLRFALCFFYLFILFTFTFFLSFDHSVVLVFPFWRRFSFDPHLFRSFFRYFYQLIASFLTSIKLKMVSTW